MDKSSFLDGNTMFLGIGHQVKVHYSYRQSNGKWAADQKHTLLDQPVDQYVTNITPKFIRTFSNFTLFGIDKDKSNEMADYYRGSRTYARVIALGVNDSENIEIHYLRKYESSDVGIKTPVPNSKTKNPGDFIWIHKRLSQSEIDGMYMDPKGGVVTFATPNPSPGCHPR